MSRTVARSTRGELAQDVVADGVAVHVVDRLEVVEVGEHERQRRAEALGARDLRGERVLALAAVRDAGEPVDERLPLDDPVQPRVLERDRRVRGERAGGHRAAPSSNDSPTSVSVPKRRAAGGERQLEPLAVRVRVAGLDDACRRRRRSRAPRRAGGLDRGLDDHAQQLLDVVGRGERLAEAGDRVAEAAALGVELGEPRLRAGPPSR